MSNNPERNVLTFSVSSLLIQIFISFMIVFASTGASLQDTDTAQNLLTEQTNIVESQTTSVGITEAEVGDLRGATSVGLQYDPINYLLNIGSALGKAIEIISGVGLTYLTLSVYASTVINFGWIIGSLIGIWQFATIYYLLTFMFPGRFK